MMLAAPVLPACHTVQESLWQREYHSSPRSSLHFKTLPRPQAIFYDRTVYRLRSPSSSTRPSKRSRSEAMTGGPTGLEETAQDNASLPPIANLLVIADEQEKREEATWSSRQYAPDQVLSHTLRSRRHQPPLSSPFSTPAHPPKSPGQSRASTIQPLAPTSQTAFLDQSRRNIELADASRGPSQSSPPSRASTHHTRQSSFHSIISDFNEGSSPSNTLRLPPFTSTFVKQNPETAPAPMLGHGEDSDFAYQSSLPVASPSVRSLRSLYTPEIQRVKSPSGLQAQRPLPDSFSPSSTFSAQLATPPAHVIDAYSLSAPASPAYMTPRHLMQPQQQQHHHYISPSAASVFPLSQDRYLCPVCNKAFSRPSSLRIHSHSHSGEKPFRCPHSDCGKAFSVRSNMKRHERGCHAGSTTILG